MIDFQIAKVKNLKQMSEDVNGDFLFQELCNVVLELLAKEKVREREELTK